MSIYRATFKHIVWVHFLRGQRGCPFGLTDPNWRWRLGVRDLQVFGIQSLSRRSRRTPSEPQSAISGAADAAVGAALAGPSAGVGADGAELARPLAALAAPFAGFFTAGRVADFGAARFTVRGTKAVTGFLGRSASAFACASALAFALSSSSSSCSSRSAGVG